MVTRYYLNVVHITCNQIFRFIFNNLQSKVTLLLFFPMALVALITTVYMVLRVALKLQFIVDSVTSLQSLWGAIFG